MKKNVLTTVLFLLVCFLNAENDLPYDLNADDSQFNDSVTLEFCLQDSKKNNYCLYHNVRKIKNFNYDNFEIFKEWTIKTEKIRWDKQENSDLSVTWNHKNGAILFLETSSPDYSTKRGVRVGDPISKFKQVYGDDKNLSVFDYKEK